jgi:hypothetical protein
MEGTLDDVRLEVDKLSKHWEHALRERSPPLFPTAPQPPEDPLLKLHEHFISSLASERPPAADITDRPHGHCYDNCYREDGFGSVTTLVHPPVKGACRLPTAPSHSVHHVKANSGDYHRSASTHANSIGRLPKLNFPTFDGADPKLWLSRCVDYFELYEVEQSRWIMVSTMHFVPQQHTGYLLSSTNLNHVPVFNFLPCFWIDLVGISMRCSLGSCLISSS